MDASAASRCCRPSPVVGIDLVRVTEVTASIERFGSRYLQRVFTAAELAYAERGTPPERDRRLAARFAAKEATLKVLGPDRHWFDWRHLEVVRAASGACSMQLHGPALALAHRRGLGELAMSLSHDEPFAVAVVTGLRWPDPEPAPAAPPGHRPEND